MKTLLFLITVALPSFAFSKVILKGTSEGMPFVVEEIHSGLGVPWGFDFMDKNQIILTERSGRLSLFDLERKKQKIITGLPEVFVHGQGGLMDVKLHPEYPKNPWVYVTFSEKVQGQGVTTLARFQLDKLKVKRLQKLLISKSRSSTGRHFGSRIAFDSKGYLYFSVGDRGVRPNGQNLGSHAGSILRLKDDGSIPADNPFIANKNALPEIWSYGHRNPQGLAFDKVAKVLWTIEHGPRGGDEINLVEKGKNYGWPTISYGKEYWGPIAVGESTHKKGMEQPIHYYVPSIAPCGLEVYSGKAFPRWKGNLFSGALKLTHLNRVVMRNKSFIKEERLLNKLEWRIRNVKESPEGWLYLSTDNGKVLRIKPGLPEERGGSRK